MSARPSCPPTLPPCFPPSPSPAGAPAREGKGSVAGKVRLSSAPYLTHSEGVAEILFLCVFLRSCVSTGGVGRADGAGMRRHSTVLLALPPSLLHKFTLTHSLSPLLMCLSIHVSGLEGAKEAEVKGAEVVVVATAVAAMIVAVEGHGGHYGLD